ncbi:hypothetical protein FH972_021096 [Carpinus fangiana]|uniref:Uncharacterized protein n=1 Tax=Carpinus fangiana TaxID=176857 RepID=A0A5N6KQH4_9ROSI|nr:hypothetical protein FH972_021096 [Carpinus fangiana]
MHKTEGLAPFAFCNNDFLFELNISPRRTAVEDAGPAWCISGGCDVHHRHVAKALEAQSSATLPVQNYDPEPLPCSLKLRLLPQTQQSTLAMAQTSTARHCPRAVQPRIGICPARMHHSLLGILKRAKQGNLEDADTAVLEPARCAAAAWTSRYHRSFFQTSSKSLIISLIRQTTLITSTQQPSSNHARHVGDHGLPCAVPIDHCGAVVNLNTKHNSHFSAQHHNRNCAFSEVAAILATAFNQAELRSIVNSELYGAPDPSGSGFFASIATAPVTFTTLPWETALPSNVAKDYAAYATKAQCDVRGIVRNDLGLPDDAQASACRALASSTGGAAAARPTAMAARVAGVAAGVAGVFGAAALL